MLIEHILISVCSVNKKIFSQVKHFLFSVISYFLRHFPALKLQSANWNLFQKINFVDMIAWYDYQLFRYSWFQGGKRKCLVFGFLNLIETAQFHADNRIKPARERQRKKGREMFNCLTQIVPEQVSIRPRNLNLTAKRLLVEKIYNSQRICRGNSDDIDY